MKPKSKAWRCSSLAAVACGSLLVAGKNAHAQTSRIIFEVSQDAINWASFAGFQPGTTYYIRMRVRLEGATALGLANLTCMPTLTGWEPQFGDERLPFTFPGLDSNGVPVNEAAYSGRHVSRVPATNTGRMMPFGAAGQSDASSSGLLTSFVDAGNVLRFAGSRATDPAATPEWGVSIAQVPSFLGPTTFDSSLDTVVFRYAIRTGFSTNVGELVAGLTQLREARVAWYTSESGTNSLLTFDPIVEDAHIAIPAPGSLAVWVAAVAASQRRRRPTARR